MLRFKVKLREGDIGRGCVCVGGGGGGGWKERRGSRKKRLGAEKYFDQRGRERDVSSLGGKKEKGEREVERGKDGKRGYVENKRKIET